MATPGPWQMGATAFGEMLPNHANKITIDETKKDKWGLPVVAIDCATGENERLMRRRHDERHGRDARGDRRQERARLRQHLVPRHGHPRNGDGANGPRPEDIGAERAQPGVGLHRTSSSPMVRAWCRRDARTPRSPTWRSPPARRRSPSTSSSAATCERRRNRWTTARQSVLTRREAVQRVAALLGGAALVGGDRLFAFSFEPAVIEKAMAQGAGAFTAADVALLDEIAETILPETSTPGAKAAKVGAFMALMVSEVYDERERQVFQQGLRQLDEACRQAHAVPFMQASAAQRLSLVEALDREQHAVMEDRAPKRRVRAPGGRARERRARALLSHDEGAHVARLLHVGDWLHAGDALHRIARAVRSQRAPRARRQVLGVARLTLRPEVRRGSPHDADRGRWLDCLHHAVAIVYRSTADGSHRGARRILTNRAAVNA